MVFKARKTELKEILPLRILFLQETNFQIRYNACHERGWTDSYRLTSDDIAIGYGSIMGREIKDRDTIFEFYLIPPFRKYASRIFPELIAASGARLLECQSNDLLLSSMLYEFSKNIHSDVVLFEDHATTQHMIPGAAFRLKCENDIIFRHKYDDDPGDFVLEIEKEIVATGGFLLHYNIPFADLYMEVRKQNRRQGFGSQILQEIKKECYLAGRAPAARCNVTNPASKATLIKAGFRVAGYMLVGDIKNLRAR